ncbi:NUDIX hydrolase [Undibacterium sp. Ji50W]|uniref:NUDIX hydrolase n=1 Tax=Undibacterium sp. Ji50W TaxID=3413041 RepID=UPI003BF113D5
MISFDIDDYRYNLRAAALILNDDSILLHQIEGDDFWFVPGGRVDAGELAATTIVREMQEELAESVVCEKLLWTVENFFTYRGQRHHEIGLYFLTHLQPGSRLLTTPGPYAGMEGKLKLHFDWFKRADLHQLDVRPSFLIHALAGLQRNEPLTAQHIVQRESE